MSDLLKKALSQYGIKEVPGIKNNPEIMKYFHAINKDWVQGDETAWCSAFINWTCIESGKQSSGELNARSWLKVGKAVTSPTLGDIVIYWREAPDSWKGHVGIYITEEASLIWTLGGNQDDMVCIKPYHKARLLGYRSV